MGLGLELAGIIAAEAGVPLEGDTMPKTGGSFVSISREDLETWLDTLPLSAKWYRLGTTAGVYMLPLSDSVAVKLNSSIGSSDVGMGAGAGSMQLALVSRIVSHGGPVVLNKKAQGQNHFARTINWRTNWAEGIARMKDAYLKAQGFYDSLALIEDREKYKADLLSRIEAIPGWRNRNILVDFHSRLEQNGILSTAQAAILIREEGQQPAPTAPAGGTPALSPQTQALLGKMRDLYRAAKEANDAWLVGFLTSVGKALKEGGSLTPKQQEVLDKNFLRYKQV